MADTHRQVSGPEFNALANDVSDLVIKHTTLGEIGLGDALGVIVSVVTDYALDNFHEVDPVEVLCSIIRNRASMPRPQAVPIQPGSPEGAS